MPLVKSVATLYQVYLYILLDALIIAEITIRLTDVKVRHFLITICQVNDGKNLTFNNEYIMKYLLLWCGYELIRPKVIWLWYYLIKQANK